LCVVAKSVWVCGVGGASDSIVWVTLLNSGQKGVPNEEGNQRLAAASPLRARHPVQVLNIQVSLHH